MRTIKSFVLRAGRLSPRQKLGLEQFLPDYQLAVTDKPWDWSLSFGRVADVIIEIGFGMGQTLVEMAKAAPDSNFLGIEVHQPGIGNLAMTLHEQHIENVRIAPYDAVEVLQHAVDAGSVTGVNIFFPDPWPKARHHKRRLVQPAFINLLVSRLKPGGWLHLATDWEEYALQMLEVLSQHPDLINCAANATFVPRPDERPLTKFEQRGLKLGHGVWDLKFQRKVNSEN
jgi:tRNA (guanine-N7-)-methyltransferase